MKNHALNRFDIYYALALEPGALGISQLLTMGSSMQKENGHFSSEICLFIAVSFRY